MPARASQLTPSALLLHAFLIRCKQRSGIFVGRNNCDKVENVVTIMVAGVPVITFKPYIFECFLAHAIDVANSKVTIVDGLANWKMFKQQQGLWNLLEIVNKDDKVETAKIRQMSITEVQEMAVERNKRIKTEKRLGEKDSLAAMMNIEGEELKRFERIKKESTEAAMRELVALQIEKEKVAEAQKVKVAEAVRFARELSKNTAGRSLSVITASVPKNYIFKEQGEDLPVRESNKINISFTPRVFPTPGRESMKVEEETWLENQAEHRRFLREKVSENEDLSEAEKDPLWLQKKANSLFQAGDFDAAAFAYTEAIKRAPKLPILYLNRAACQIKLRNFFRALEDSSTALDLLRPPVPQNLRARVKAHVRRGVAFCNLEMLKEGAQEYEAAAKLDPTDKTIKADLESLKNFLLKPTLASHASTSPCFTI